MIQPTVGRVVYFFLKEAKYDFGFCFLANRGHAAIITAVHSDTMINVVAFDANGKSHGFASVELKQDETQQMYGSVHCEWMPYQQQKAKVGDNNSESAEPRPK